MNAETLQKANDLAKKIKQSANDISIAESIANNPRYVKVCFFHDSINRISDPISFFTEDQKRTLATMVNAFTQQNLEAFEARTTLNREIAHAEAQVNAVTVHPDLPAEEQSVESIVKELRAAEAHNAERATLFTKSGEAESRHNRYVASRDDVKKQIVQLEARLLEARGRLAIEEENVCAADQEAQRASDALDAFVLKPVDDYIGQIANLQETNRKIRSNKDRATKASAARELVKAADALTDKIDKLDAEKEEILTTAKMPIPGLTFTDAGLLYNAIPFDQASAAEQLRVSAAMGMAMNPKLRVMMIRDASLIDEGGMVALAELAKEKDFQLWLERVGAGADIKVIIEEAS